MIDIINMSKIVEYRILMFVDKIVVLMPNISDDAFKLQVRFWGKK